MKLLLTLLALLTGLAAAPAQARMCASDPSGVEQVESRSGGGGALAAAVAESERKAAQRQQRERRLAPAPRPVVTILIPSIQYGDRALE